MEILHLGSRGQWLRNKKRRNKVKYNKTIQKERKKRTKEGAFLPLSGPLSGYLPRRVLQRIWQRVTALKGPTGNSQWPCLTRQWPVPAPGSQRTMSTRLPQTMHQPSSLYKPVVKFY